MLSVTIFKWPNVHIILHCFISALSLSPHLAIELSEHSLLFYLSVCITVNKSGWDKMRDEVPWLSLSGCFAYLQRNEHYAWIRYNVICCTFRSIYIMYTKLCNEFFGVVQCLLSTAYIRGQGVIVRTRGGRGYCRPLALDIFKTFARICIFTYKCILPI